MAAPAFNMLDFIARKKAGGAHPPEELQAFVAALCDPGNPLPDYQVAAWLMAVCWRDLDFDETAALTLAMAHSGQTCDWSDFGVVVDKHSTGGVGDKTTIVLAPLIASLGIPFPKFSGRALGFTGGTLDKLESIPGFRVDLSLDEMCAVLHGCGCVIAGQTAAMVPADKLLYALRDVTMTIDNIALIAASVMSKKIAGGANGIVLDVKYGDGAFMATRADAQRLADTMVAIGERTGRRVRTVLSSMDQPLGYAIGNALEVIEAIGCLKGEGPQDLEDLCVELAHEMVAVYLECGGDPKKPIPLDTLTPEAIRAHLRSGAAIPTMRQWVELQGGDPRVVDDPESYLPQALGIKDIPSSATGIIRIKPRSLGELVRGLGGGRRIKADFLDPAVGVVLVARPLSHVRIGEVIARLHHTNPLLGPEETGWFELE